MIFIVLVLCNTIICLANGNIVILNGHPCVGKSTTATELQKLIPGSEIVRFDEVLKDASFEFGVKLGLFTHENNEGPDNKYGYNGLSYFIQYVCEHRVCSDSELEELFDLRLRPFQKATSLAQKGITVIFDGVVTQANERLGECIQMLSGTNITFVLLYLSLKGTAKRYAQSGREGHGILHVFGYNYPWFYRMQEKEDEPVLIRSSYQEMVSLIRSLDKDIPLILRERCIHEIATRFQLKENERIVLTPRMSHDLVIDVQELSVQDCAKRIVEYLHEANYHSTKFFDNAILPKPNNANELRIVPELSPKYLEQNSKL